MGFTGNVGVYKSIHLMASVGSRHQNNFIVQMGSLGTLRVMLLVKGHITDDKEKLGLNPAVSLELGSLLHPGLPETMEWVVLVSLCTDMAWVGGEQSSAQRYPWEFYVNGKPR